PLISSVNQSHDEALSLDFVLFCFVMFFFFQAEDGIRDGHVTGVQTCALPICPSPSPSSPGDKMDVSILLTSILSPGDEGEGLGLYTAMTAFAALLGAALGGWVAGWAGRSEERRVGRECRWRGARGE